MLFKILIGCLLLSIGLLMPISAQELTPNANGPVTSDEVSTILSRSPQTPEAIEKTNRELIAAIESRSVDFALTKEQEWSLKLLEASDELIEAIRTALTPEEREWKLKIAEQERLYYAFANNYKINQIESRREALEAGKEFIRRFSDDEWVGDIVIYMKRAIPQLERSIRFLERSVRTRGRKN